MPDDIPVIGPCQTAPAPYHAFGFSGHGFAVKPDCRFAACRFDCRWMQSDPARGLSPRSVQRGSLTDG